MLQLEAYDMLAELASQSSNGGSDRFCVDSILCEHLAQYKETIGNEFRTEASLARKSRNYK